MHVCCKQRRNIGEQAQRHPFQDHDVTIIVREHDADDAGRPECNDVEKARAADQQFRRIRHRAGVGTDIDRVGEEQKRHDDLQEPIRVVPAQIAGDPMTRRASEPSADFLYRHHQRIGQQHRPADAKAQLCPCLAVSADTGGIVVGRPGDQTWSEHPKKTREGS